MIKIFLISSLQLFAIESEIYMILARYFLLYLNKKEKNISLSTRLRNVCKYYIKRHNKLYRNFSCNFVAAWHKYTHSYNRASPPSELLIINSCYDRAFHRIKKNICTLDREQLFARSNPSWVVLSRDTFAFLSKSISDIRALCKQGQNAYPPYRVHRR